MSPETLSGDEATRAPEDWVTIGRYSTVHEALVVKGTLESNDVEVQLLDAETVGVDWLLSNAIGGVRVQVKEARRAVALEILAEQPLEAEAGSAEPIEPARDRASEISDDAKRTLVAALLGFMVPVVPNLYSLYLAVGFTKSWGDAPHRARLWVIVAVLIDAFVAAILLVLLRGF